MDIPVDTLKAISRLLLKSQAAKDARKRNENTWVTMQYKKFLASAKVYPVGSLHGLHFDEDGKVCTGFAKKRKREPVADSEDDLSKRAALERESLVKAVNAVPFKVGEKVVVGKEKKECFVKKILPEQGYVLVQADDDDGLFSFVDGRQCSLASLERESMVKAAIAVPFKVGEKVVVGKEKKECFVKKILPEQGYVLVQADDDGLFRWFDGRQCSPLLVEGKPVLEPKIEIKISFPNTKENSEPATSTATSGTSTLRRRTPEEMERIMAPYRKRQEDNKRRHEETFENLESSKKAIVEKIRNLVGKGAVNFQESAQSRNGYLCTICESEAPEFLNGFVDDDWTDDGGQLHGALPLKRLLQDCDATIRWEDASYFVTANVYLKK